MNDSFFSTDRLTVGYNGRPLVRDISFSLKKGEILTLIGPNGSGKSTILKSITRHLPTLSGSVWLDGKNVRRMGSRELASRLAVVLTDRIRPELMTCRELVSAGRYPYTGSFGVLTDRDREVVAASLARVHASDIADRDFSAISDGQRQRVLLARAIAQEPELIVLDEPTSFLDIRHKIELLEILGSMAREQGITVILSLHEIDLAYKIADKIACVKDGCIRAYGTPEEIFTGGLIDELYDIDRGSFHPLLGTVELSRPEGKPRVFVVGGGGYGIPFYHALQKRKIPFSAGILFDNDLEYAVAAALAQDPVCAHAFSPIEEAQIARARAAIDQAQAVIDSGCPIRQYNRANGDLLTYAKKQGKPIFPKPEPKKEETP